MKTLSGITLCLLLLLRTIKSHTVAVCNSVAADGRSVTIYAGTYHGTSEVPNGGLLLTAPGQTNAVEYMFDGFQADQSNVGLPPACSQPGVNCDCDLCPNYNMANLQYWQTKTVNNLVDGTYQVMTTTHTQVEWPYGTCNTPWTFTITGSVATGAPTRPSTSPTNAPVIGPVTNRPTLSPTISCDSDADCGAGAECEDVKKHCVCKDNFIGDPRFGGACLLNCPNGTDIKTFNWDTMTEQGIDIPKYDLKTFAIIPDDLAIDITIELEYLGDVSADDDRVGPFGVTYVLDFEDFDAHEDSIADPGTCQNRDESDFNAPNFAGSFSDYWDFSPNPHVAGNLGVSQYLAYPPPGDYWNVFMDDCGNVTYSAIFTWEDLRGCNDGNGGNSYTQVVTDDDWLNLTGTFYVNVVSPFWPDQDFGYYRVYQILSQPFVIAVSSVVNVLGSTGINLMTLSVIAVYKEDADNDFKLVLLTETADYLKLTRDANSVFNYVASDANNQLQTSDFTDNTDPENTGTNECLSNKAYICSQLWEINATNIGCTNGGLGTDFSGNYQLSFTPECRSTGDANLDAYCGNWLTTHPNIQSGVALDTDLVWVDEVCDPIIFIIQFEAEMTFYTDATYGTEIADDHLYQVGEDYIYVQVNTSFPTDTFDVFNVSLVEVHICTFDPLLTVPNDPSDLSTFGCFNAQRDNYDQYFYKIFDEDGSSVNNPTFSIDSDIYTNAVRFSFQVPNEVARDTLYVQAELEVALQELGGRRRNRRVLLRGRGAGGPKQGGSNGNNQGRPRAEAETANQISNFVQTVGINHGQKIYYEPKEEPKQQPHEQPRQNPHDQPEYYPPQQPIQPVNPVTPVSPVVPNAGPATWTINLSSPWVMGIGGLLALVLSANILFMCYMNCCKGPSERPMVLFGKRKGYKKVKFVDSEDFSENDSAANAINVVSDE